MPRPPLPPLPPAADRDAVLAARLTALALLLDALEAHLAGPGPAPPPAEDLAWRHLAKAVATGRGAVLLLRAGAWADAAILTRAVIEQLFAYGWVVHDPALAAARAEMATLKQAWANAQYLEALAATAPPADASRLAAAAGPYREAADRLLGELSARLDLSPAQVRRAATTRVSEKAVAVQVDPRFSIPFAHYSGFVHSDGTALAWYGPPVGEAGRYGLGPRPARVPVAADLHHALLAVVGAVREACPALGEAALQAELAAHVAWLGQADALDPPWAT
ncbi:MAG: DUF5677 domain-containing protein [Candidatus Sericytochromatia bacterium]|nr:DUF5677 domain-containing protein [Candidatus Sericytochromatia bacterium]